MADTQALHSATYPLVQPRPPDRPMTLSRPGQLPSCCNFKRQHWRLYVQGEFSYSSLPRYFKGAERELNTSYKDDLESIISELSGKDRGLELERSNQLARSLKSPESKSLSVSKAADSNDDSGKFLLENVGGLPTNSGICDSENHSKISSEKSLGADNDCRHVPNNADKHSVADQNRCLMEDINRNCENIKSQLAILENVSEMIDRAQTKLTAENKCRLNGKNVELDSNALPLAAKDAGPSLNPSLDSTEALQANQIPPHINKTDVVQPLPTFEGPPPPPPPPSAEFLLRGELSSSSFSSSSSKKLKSRKSRNRSLQRCSEERLSAAERRSRTLSPSITERLDYRVSRATQTLDGPSKNSDAIPHIDLEMLLENGKSCTEAQIGKIMTSQPFTGLTPAKPLEPNYDSGSRATPGQSSKKEFRKCVPTMNMLSKKIFFSSESHATKSPDVCKSSTATSQNGKTSVKNTVSFAASIKSKINEEPPYLDDPAQQELAEAAQSTEPDGAETSVKQSETLLDRMHKKLYPYQYNKQNRTRSAEALSQTAKNGLNQPNGSPRPATLPQTKPTSLTSSVKVRNCGNASLDKSLQTKPLESIIRDDPPAINTVINEDSRSVDFASPSSGYSEISPSSLKDNAASPLSSSSSSSKRLRFVRTLSPEQLTTSSCTPSPPDDKMSLAVGANSSSHHLKDEEAATTNKVSSVSIFYVMFVTDI